MAEINKPNDIFVTTLLNPQSSTNDLIQSGFNTKNTLMLTPEEYKETPFVKNSFTDLNGVFNEDAFNKVYQAAHANFDRLDSIKTYKDLNDDIVYNSRSIFKPIDGKTKTPTFELERVKNPFDTSMGVRSIYGEGVSDKSAREIAQGSKIWDTKNNKWMDKSAEELGFFGNLFSEPIVYAVYDKDDWYVNQETGQREWHTKGEWKVNADGKYYTETLGDREYNGQQVVAYSDILTKENSWMNKIDFMDSDGKNKSVFGTVMKTAAQIAPYLIPGVGTYWGGVSAAINLAEVMPTFYKIFEGIVNGDNGQNSSMYNFANKAEAYMRRFDDSYSDDAMNSNWDIEKMGNMAADVFGQIYQMRAMAKLSELSKATSLNSTQAKNVGTFLEQHADEMAQAISSGYVKNPQEFIQMAMMSSPEWQAAIKSQSELAKKLSLGYMALTSSADVYQEALDGGYGHRAAGLAALAATVGQYGIMMNDEVGTWFLDKTVGYSEKANRAALRKALQGEYDNLKKISDKLVTKEGKEEGLKGFAKVVSKVKLGGTKVYNALKYGEAESILGNAGIESIEEMTEEAVMDATKGMFDALSYFGFAGMQGSFGGWDNVFSKQGIEKYLTDAVGGFVGGALFKLNDTKIEPWIKGEVISPENKYAIIHEIANGNTNELLKAIDDLCSHDTALSDAKITVGDQNVAGTTNNGLSQTQIVRNGLRQYVQYMDSVINGREFGISDELLAQRALRNSVIIPMVKEAKIDTIITSDYNKAIDDFAKAKSEYDAVASKGEPEDDAKKADYKLELKNKQKAVKEAEKAVQDILDGNRGEYYVKAATTYLGVRQFFTVLDKYSYAKAVYGKDWKDIPKTGTFSQQSLEEEYKTFTEGKQMRQEIDKLVKIYDFFGGQFSRPFATYAESKYGKEVRQTTMQRVFSRFIYNFADALKLNSAEGGYNRNMLALLSDIASKSGIENLSLNDLVQVTPEVVEQTIMASVDGFKEHAAKLDKALGLTDGTVMKSITSLISEQLSKMPISSVNSEMINQLIDSVLMAYAQQYNEKLSKLDSSEGDIVNPEIAIAKLTEDGLLEGFSIDPAQIRSNEDMASLVFQAMRGNFNGVASNSGISKGVSDANLSNFVITEFLKTQSVVDNELLLNIKKSLFNRLRYQFTQKSQLKQMFSFVEDNPFKLIEDGETPPDNYEDLNVAVIKDLNLAESSLFNAITDGINKNIPFQQVISNWVDTNIHTGNFGITTDEMSLLEYRDFLKSEIYRYLHNDLTDSYDIAVSKPIENNPLYDALRQLSFVVSGDGLLTNLFDLLHQEEQSIAKAGSLLFYVDNGFSLEKVRNMRHILNIASGIIAGMQTTPGSDMDSSFGVNRQINYFHEKYGGELEGDYAEISAEMAAQLGQELAILDQKLKFLQSAMEGNAKSIKDEDEKAGQQFRSLMIKAFEGLVDVKVGEMRLISVDEEKILTDPTIDNEHKEFLMQRAIYENGQKIIQAGKAQELVGELIKKYPQVANGRAAQTNGISSESKMITDDDLFGYVLMTLSINPDEFAKKYSEMATRHIAQTENAKVPFFAQKLALKYALGFFKQQHDGGDNNLYKIATDILKNTENGKSGTIYQYGIFFVNGITGAGKTSIVLRDAIEMIRLEYDTIDIIACAPGKRLVDTLFESITSDYTDSMKETITKHTTKQTKNELFAMLFDQSKIKYIKDKLASDDKTNYELYFEVNEKTNMVFFKEDALNGLISKSLDISKIRGSIIVIDEISHFDAIDIQILAQFCAKNNITLLTGGDTLQLGAYINNGKLSLPHNIDDFRCVITPKLRTSVRPSTTVKWINNQTLFNARKRWEDIVIREGEPVDRETRQQKVNGILLDGLQLSYLEGNGRFEGEKVMVDPAFNSEDAESGKDFVESLKNMKAAFDEKKKQKPNIKIGILTNVQDGKIASQDLIKALQEAEIKEDDIILYSPEYFDDKAVQGAEEEFFVVSNINWSNDVPELLSQLYTYTSRSFSGTLVSMPQPVQVSLRLINTAVSDNQEYRVPTSTQAKEDLQKEIDFYTEMLKGRNYSYSKKRSNAALQGKDSASEDIDKKLAELDEIVGSIDNENRQGPTENGLLIDDSSKMADGRTPEQSQFLESVADGNEALGYGFVKNLSMYMGYTEDTGMFIEGSNLNLDSFFSDAYFTKERFPSGIRSRLTYKTGFYNFTTLLLYYDFTNPSQELIDAIDGDNNIKEFAYALFGTRDAKEIISIVGDTQKHPVIIAEDFRKDYNRNYTAFDYNPDKDAQDKLLTIGYRVKDVTGRTRYFSIAGLPLLTTVLRKFPDSNLAQKLQSLYDKAEQALQASGREKGKRAAVLKVVEEISPIEQDNVVLSGNKAVNPYLRFVTGGQLVRITERNSDNKIEQATLTLDEIIKHDNVNIAGAWFITDEQEEYENGEKEFAFINFLVNHNIGVNPSMTEEEKREYLRKKYVKDGVLTCRGSYLFKFTPTGADSDTFSRYIIFNNAPHDALETIREIRSRYSKRTSDDRAKNLLAKHLMSPYSQLELVARVLGDDKLFLSESKTEKLDANRLSFLEGWLHNVEEVNKKLPDEKKDLVTPLIINKLIDLVKSSKTKISYKLVLDELMNIYKNQYVPQVFTRRIGISFATNGVLSLPDGDKLILARKTELGKTIKWGYLQNKEGKTTLTWSGYKGVYAGYQLDNSTEKTQKNGSGLVPFLYWTTKDQRNDSQIVDDIRKHLVTNYAYEAAKVTWNLDLDLEIDEDFKFQETLDGKMDNTLREWTKTEEGQKQMSSINTTEYTGLRGINIGEVFANSGGTRMVVTGYGFRDGDVPYYYVINEEHPDEQVLPISVVEMNQRLANGTYKRFMSATSNKFQSGTIISYSEPKANSEERIELVGMIIGIEGDNYVYVPIQDGKLKNEFHKRPISLAETEGSNQLFKILQEYKYEYEENKSLSKTKKNGSVFKVKSIVYRKPFDSTDSTGQKHHFNGHYVRIISVDSKTKKIKYVLVKKSNGKTGRYVKQSNTVYEGNMSDFSAARESKKVTKKLTFKDFKTELNKLIESYTKKTVLTIKTKDIEQLAAESRPKRERQRKLADAAKLALKPVAAEEKAEAVETPKQEEPPVVVTPTPVVTAKAENAEPLPASKIDELARQESKLMLDSVSGVEIISSKDLKDRVTSVNDGSYFILPIDPTGIDFASGILVNFLEKALTATPLNQDQLRDIRLLDYEGKPIIVLKFNDDVDSLYEAVEGSLVVPNENIMFIVDTFDSFNGATADAQNNPDTSLNKIWGVNKITSLPFVEQALEQPDVQPVEQPKAEAPVVTTKNNMPMDKLYLDRMKEVEEILKLDNPYGLTVDNLLEVSQDGKFAFFATRKGNIGMDGDCADDTKRTVINGERLSAHDIETKFRC